MKRIRLPFVVAGAVVVLLVVAVGVGFSSAFQTWMARRVLAGLPELHATIGSISVGVKRIEATDVRVVHEGAVLTVPLMEIELPLLAAVFEERVEVRRLAATGWSLDLTRAAAPVVAMLPASQPATNNPGSPNSGAAPASVTPLPATEPSTPAAEAFSGIFLHRRMPVRMSVDGVELEGRVILPESRGTMTAKLTGGGLAANREGRFELLASAALADPGVKTVEVRGTLVAAMDTPRSFERVAAQLDVAAAGTKFPNGVTLRADVSAVRAENGEQYSAALVAGGKDVIAITAALPRNANAFSGGWKLDVRDSEIAPFALGKPLPVFSAKGEGKFDGDAHFDALHAAGRLNATVGRLEFLLPELSSVGELKITSDFDLARHAGTIAVKKFEAAVNASEPVASIRVLQPFEITPSRAELRTADTTRELVGVALQGVPVRWVAPFVKELKLDGGHLRGQMSLAAGGGGVTLRSTAPLRVDGVSVAQEGKTLIEKIDFAVKVAADYTPAGWQAQLAEFSATSGDASLLTLDAKVGRLTGENQSLKAAGTVRANLPAMMMQPGAAGKVTVTAGEAAMDFAVSLNEKTEIQADVALKELATVVDTNAVQLPALSTKLRADISSDGKIAFNAPILLERAGQKSDLTIIGSIGPEKEKLRAIDATVTSTQLIIEDAEVFAAIIPSAKQPAPADPSTPPSTAPAPAPTIPRDTAPPWAGVYGVLALQLKRIIYSDAVQVSNVTGRLRIDAGTLKLESMQAGLGESGRADLSGTVTFNAAEPQPYAMVADVTVREFDPGPVFRAISRDGQPATVEGKFDVTSKLNGRAATLGDLASGAGGTFQLTSKGGVFRGLPVDVGHIVENTGKIATLLASAGTAISAMTGKKDSGEVANKAEAVAELARGLNPLPFDQLSVSVARDAALNTTLRNFTLISPEVRLTGNGTALHKPGSCLLEDSLAMEFTLRVRGRQGELLKYLGALEPQTDDLGYATCTVPLKIGGSLGKPDTSELNTKLTALAIEKSGFGDKAADFLNRIRGGK